MRKLVTIAALALLSISAHAAGTYNLVSVVAYNIFAPTGSAITSSGGTATVDGSGNVTTSGLAFSFTSSNAAFTYTNGSWSTTVGGSTVSGSGTCIETVGTPCSGGVSGLLAANSGTTTFFGTGTQNDGTTASNTCAASNFFPAGSCDQVSVVETASQLIITEQSEFAAAGFGSGYVWTFNLIPVPAAVWLFGSALGLLGFVRRRMAL